MSEEFESIVTDLRAVVDFPEVMQRRGLIVDGNVLIPVERLATLLQGLDELRAIEQRARDQLADCQSYGVEMVIRKILGEMPS